MLQARRIELDLDANEGVAEGAVLRFLGAPILGMPALSFPLTDARKSGWLPPSVNVDNRSGVEVAVPYYWNIAPNRDATITPRVMTRRGLGLDTEFRYLEPRFEGGMLLQWLPNDQVAERSREALQWRHEGLLGAGVRYGLDLARVSDDDWWKDFPDAGRGVTARLLPLRLQAERPFGLPGGTGEVYARALRWQVLQAEDSFIDSPYERSPQVGARLGAKAGDWHYALQAEFNRFTLPHDQEQSSGRTVGERLHMVGSLQSTGARTGLVAGARGFVQRGELFQQRQPHARRRPGRGRPAADSRPSAWTAGWSSSATRHSSAAACTRRWSRACST